MGVASEGDLVTNKATLNGSRQGKSDGSSSVGRMKVRCHGANVAVVVGAARQSNKATTSYRFTDTWIERDGNWQCIASQAKALKKGDEAAFGPVQQLQTGSNLPRRHH